MKVVLKVKLDTNLTGLKNIVQPSLQSKGPDESHQLASNRRARALARHRRSGRRSPPLARATAVRERARVTAARARASLSLRAHESRTRVTYAASESANSRRTKLLRVHGRSACTALRSAASSGDIGATVPLAAPTRLAPPPPPPGAPHASPTPPAPPPAGGGRRRTRRRSRGWQEGHRRGAPPRTCSRG